MAEQTPQFGPRDSLDAYLDDQLTPDQCAQFEAQLLRDEGMRLEVARQREIDQSLNRMFFTTASPDAILSRLTKPAHAENGRARQQPIANKPEPTRRFIRMPLAIAAAIAFLICGPLAIWNGWEYFTRPKAQEIVRKVQPLDSAYRDEVNKGFKCDWECKTQSEFAAYFASGFGQPLQMKEMPTGIASIGLKYCGGITAYTISYMAKVQGQPVMVFADRLDKDEGQTLSNTKGLKIFRREIGELVLYEVTPLEEPKLLELFYAP